MNKLETEGTMTINGINVDNHKKAFEARFELTPLEGLTHIVRESISWKAYREDNNLNY